MRGRGACSCLNFCYAKGRLQSAVGVKTHRSYVLILTLQGVELWITGLSHKAQHRRYKSRFNYITCSVGHNYQGGVHKVTAGKPSSVSSGVEAKN